jgi:hypothetical protein
MHVNAEALRQLATSLDAEGAYTPSGIWLTHTPRNTVRMGMINDYNIQNLAVAKALEILGEDAWTHSQCIIGLSCTETKDEWAANVTAAGQTRN